MLSLTFKSLRKMEAISSNERIKDAVRMHTKYGALLANE